MSLAGDGLTTRGEAYRNASLRDLCEFAGPRGAVRLTKEKALEIVSGPLATASTVTAFATDALPGLKVMDVEEYEGRLASLRDECLSYAPRLFVEDAAVGSSRASEVRVRVITDSPAVALFFRNTLHAIPLYAPQAFPRTLTVYAATLAGDAIAAGRGIAGPYTVVDVDPATARGTVAAAGPVSLEALRDAVAAAAAQLQSIGGYRHKLGGSHVPVIAEAQRDGVAGWYFRDGHQYAAPGEAHPDLLPLKGDVIVEDGGKGVALVVGAPAGAVAGPAASKGRLYSAHNTVWEGSGALAAAWAGVTAKGLPLVRGALVAQGGVTVPLEGAAKTVAAPSRVIVVGGAAATAAGIKAAAGLTDKQAEKLEARLAATKAGVEAVATAADALKALKL